MKGKNFYKKVFPWLGASVYFFPNKTLDFLNLIETPKEIIINAKAEKIEGLKPTKSTVNENESFALQNYIQHLNQTEVYILVTKPLHKKTDNNVLLLLQNENRLNSVPALSKRRFQIIQTRRDKNDIPISKINAKRVNEINAKRAQRKLRKKIFLSFTLKVQEAFPFARFWTTGRSYNTNDLAGYKSISPIFFSKQTAEDFLIKTTRDTLSISNYNIGLDEGSKNIIKSILNSKIITVGLGDFVHYYSLPSNEKFLNKIEFLFFPNLEDLSGNQQKSLNSISTKSFNFYQNNYYKLKSNTGK